MKIRNSIILVFSIAICYSIVTNSFIKKTFIVSITNAAQLKKCDVWFNHAMIDTMNISEKFRYFIFCKNECEFNDQDSSLFILNNEAYSKDTIVTNITNKVWLPKSAFPFIMKENENYMLFRIDTIEKVNGRKFYKLRKIK